MWEEPGEPRGTLHVPGLLEPDLVLFSDGVTVMVRFSVSGSDLVELVVRSSSSLVDVCVCEATAVGATVVFVVVAVLVVFGDTGVVPSMASKTSSEPPLSSIWWMAWVLAVFSFRDKRRREKRITAESSMFHPKVLEIPLQKRYLLFMRCCARSNFLSCNRVYPHSVCVFKQSLSHVTPQKTLLHEDNVRERA